AWSPRRNTTYSPTGSPSAASSFFAYSLSMAAALANTPAPTYGTPASSANPWMVPSSPNAPCNTGKTTSTPLRTSGTVPGSKLTRPVLVGSPASTTAVPLSTVGNRPSLISSSAGSAVPSTQPPSGVIPTGTISNRSRSRFASTLPAETHEMACSLLRPPNTTAIRVLPVSMGTQRTGSPRYTSARSVARGAAAPASQQLGQDLDGSPQLVAGACGVAERDPAVSGFPGEVSSQPVQT